MSNNHVRPWSKKCPKYHEYKATKGVPNKTGDTANTAPMAEEEDNEQALRDATEQSLLDKIEFDADTEFVTAVEDILKEDSSSE